MVQPCEFYLKVEGGRTAVETTAQLHAYSTYVSALTVGKIELVLLHFPKALTGSSLKATIQEQWRAIAGVVESGGAAVGGVSQFCAAAVASLDRGELHARSQPGRTARRCEDRSRGRRIHGQGAKIQVMQRMAYSALAEAD